MIYTFFYAAYNYSYIKTEINENVESAGLRSLFAITFLLELIPNYVSPHLSLISALLLNLNPFMASFTIILSSTISSMLGFEFGRKYGKHFVSETLGKKRVKRIEERINLKGGKSTVLLAAITPVPYIPLVIGSLLMGRKNFIIWGVIPRQLSYVITGIVFALFIN